MPILVNVLAVAICMLLALLDTQSRLFLLLWCLMPLPLVVIHEAGHILGGRLVGFRFFFLTLGRLRLARRRGRIRIGLVKGQRIPWGMAGCLPTDDHDLRRRLAVMIAGGPAANLLCGLLSGVWFLSLHYDWDMDSFLSSGASIFGFTLFSVAAWSLLFFLVNLVPFRSSGFLSDGAVLLQLLRSGPKAERQAAIFLLGGMSWAGRRAREWPKGLVERAAALPDGSGEDARGSLFAYFWLLDQGNIDGAAGFLERALAAQEQYPLASRPLLFREAAYFAGRHRVDARAGRAFLERSKGGMLAHPSAEMRAEAAVLFAERNLDAARRCAQEGLAAIERTGTMGAGLVDADWLREIIALCDESTPPSPPGPDCSGGRGEPGSQSPSRSVLRP